MIVYLGQNRPLDGVERHLLDRRANELIQSWWDTWRIRTIDGNVDGVYVFDITQAARQHVFEFLESVDAVCVDLEPADIPVLAGGRSVATFAAAELLRDDSSVQAACQRITPGEIIDEVSKLIAIALQHSDRMAERADQIIASAPDLPTRMALERERAIHEEGMVARLRGAGFDVPDAIDLEPAALEEDFDDLDAKFGSGAVSTRVADPWQFNN